MNFNYLFNLTLTFSALDRLHNWTTNEKVFLLSFLKVHSQESMFNRKVKDNVE